MQGIFPQSNLVYCNKFFSAHATGCQIKPAAERVKDCVWLFLSICTVSSKCVFNLWSGRFKILLAGLFQCFVKLKIMLQNSLLRAFLMQMRIIFVVFSIL